MTWFDVIDSETGHFVAEAEGLSNAKGACEQLLQEGYGHLRVVRQGATVATAHAQLDGLGSMVWKSGRTTERYPLERSAE